MRDPSKVPPRGMIALVAVTGVGVDLATLSWLWDTYNTVTGPEVWVMVTALAGTGVAAALLCLAVAMSVRRSRG